MYKVTYPFDENDKLPRIGIFPDYWDAQEWIDLVVNKQVAHLVAHLEDITGEPYSEDDIKGLKAQEKESITIEDVDTVKEADYEH